MSSGALRAMHRWSGLGPPLEGYPLSADCGCCETFPDMPPVTYMVDLGERTTITGSGTAHFYSYAFQHSPGAFWPYVTMDAGSVCSFQCDLIPPGEISTPTGMTDNGAGENKYWLREINWTFGDQSGTDWSETGSTATPAGGEVTWSFSFPARLFSATKDLSRFNRNGTLWGPRPRAAHPEDAWDVRGYKTAAIDWYYWSPDGAGTMTIDAWGREITVGGGGPPKKVLVGGCALYNANPGSVDADAAYLEADFFGSKDAPASSNTIYSDPPANTRGAVGWTNGSGRLSTKQTGSASDYQRVQIVYTNMQPSRWVRFTAECIDAEGTNWTDETFKIDPLDGPDWTGDGIVTTVNTEYPVGTALDLKAPDSTLLTGEAYDCYVAGTLDGGSVTPLSLSDDTIGAPAFGFQYNLADLAANGQKQDAWRCGFKLPGAYSRWNAIQVQSRPDYYIETFDSGVSGWTAGTGTTVSNDSGKLHLTGTGTLSATKTFDSTTGAGTFRYLQLWAKADSGASIKLKIGTREWSFTPGAGGSVQTIDTCAPDNASGTATTSTKLIARASGGDWAWGAEAGEVWTIECSEECWIDWIRADGHGESNLTVVGESVYQNEPEFADGTYVWDSETLDVYDHRELLVVAEGRIAYDEPCGRVGDGTALFNGQRPFGPYSIQELVARANGFAGTGGLTKLVSMKPPAGGLISGWDGLFEYFKPEHYFTNHAESYLLTPAVVNSAQGENVILTADYQVDRFAPGVGVSYEFLHRKLVGGGFHGVTLESSKEPGAMTVETTENSDSTMSLANGSYVLPESAIIDVETPDSYTFQSGYGAPTASTLHGVSRRISLIGS